MNEIDTNPTYPFTQPPAFFVLTERISNSEPDSEPADVKGRNTFVEQVGVDLRVTGKSIRSERRQRQIK